ncbi:TPA: class I SAM-dependent methyltransferase [Candidatus Poribacteria bacterium]|nr:class I SAM-dependent methyltransferase [Candidatus Poribacteria bacterium]
MRRFYLTSEVYLGFLRGHDEGYLRPYVDLVSAFADPGDFILELGCGNGLSSMMLARRGYKVVGTDLSPFFLAESSGWIGPDLSYVACDALELPFKDESFDLVCSNELIEHLPDVRPALDEMARVVKPGGRIVIVGPNLCSPILPLMDLIRKLRGREDDVVWADSMSEGLKLCLRNLLISIGKRLSAKPRFIYREPDLDDKVIGGDSDSSYLASPIDLEKYFKLRGFRVERLCVGMGVKGKIMARIMPRMGLYISMVLKKPHKAGDRL